MKRVLVTGANGQLGQSILSISGNHPNLEFCFAKREDLDITNERDVISFFKKHTPDYCINCAAYTQVDKAEEESQRCFEINVNGTENLVKACLEVECILIQISTDFVFDGKKGIPYSTLDQPNPINVYGQSKYKSELALQKSLSKYFIVRTSWVYSEYGNNFVKTMLRLGKEKNEIHVVADQIGTPTYSGDLAMFLLEIIRNSNSPYGIYHYCNEGNVSWYEFASAIFEFTNSEVSIIPVASKDFKQKASRPAYSVLSVEKAKALFPGVIKGWKNRLKDLLDRVIVENGIS